MYHGGRKCKKGKDEPIFGWAHNPKVVGSNPTPATIRALEGKPLSALPAFGYEDKIPFQTTLIDGHGLVLVRSFTDDLANAAAGALVIATSDRCPTPEVITSGTSLAKLARAY